jgi:hypothetical protein
MKKTASLSIFGALALAACQGSVGIPSMETGCGSPDGAGPWAQRFGVAGSDKSMNIAATNALPLAPDGSTALYLEAYQTKGSTSVPLSAQLVKLDSAGHTLWERSWPPSVPLVSPTPDPRDCSTLVTGMIPGGSTDVLGATASCGSASCPFVARFDAGGAIQWIKVYDFGGDSWTFPSIAGVLSDGRIALAGAFEGTLDLGNGPLYSPRCGVFVAMLSPAGDALWSRHFAKDGTQGCFMTAAAVVSPTGDIAVATPADGAVDFGEGPVSSASAHGGLALASYDAIGALRFGEVIGSGYPTWEPLLSGDAAGNLIIAQPLPGPMDYGGGPIDDSAGAVAAFDAAGKYLWSAAIGEEYMFGFTVDGADHLWLGVGNGDVVELDAGGAVLGKRSFGGSGSHYALAIGVAPGGAPVIAGEFNGTLDLGTGTLVAQSQTDVFIAALE